MGAFDLLSLSLCLCLCSSLAHSLLDILSSLFLSPVSLSLSISLFSVSRLQNFRLTSSLVLLTFQQQCSIHTCGWTPAAVAPLHPWVGERAKSAILAHWASNMYKSNTPNGVEPERIKLPTYGVKSASVRFTSEPKWLTS